MRILERQYVDSFPCGGSKKSLPLAIRAAQHCVDEFARTQSVAPLRQLDRLRNRRVSRHASHEQELIHSESQQVDDVGIEAYESAAHPLGENRIDTSPMTQHPIHELASPATVARIERTNAAFE